MTNKLNEILTELKEKGNFNGVIYAHAEGISISESLNTPFDHENVVAMCASALKSAKNLGKLIEDREPQKIVVELDSKTLFVANISEKSFLILILENNSNAGSIFDDLDSYIQQLESLS